MITHTLAQHLRLPGLFFLPSPPYGHPDPLKWSVIKKTLRLLPVLIFAVAVSSAQTTSFSLLSAKDTVKVCENPWKGWYQHFYDGNLSNYAVAQGTRDSYLDDFPGMDHLNIRLSWSFFEPQQNVYDWSKIDNLIAYWGPKGYKFSVRVTTYDPWVIQYATPQWVINAGAAGQLITPAYASSSYWEPDYDDPVFMNHWNDFQQAMAARYDNNPYISYLDIGGLGCWGEGHHNDGDKTASTLTVLKQHVDVYKNHWLKMPLVISDDFVSYNARSTDLPAIRDYIESRNISYRDDSPLVDWYVDTYPATFSVQSPPLFTATYLQRPTVLEAEHYDRVKSAGNWIGTNGITKGAAILRGAVKLMHASYIGFHYFPNIWLTENPALAKELANLCGYWYGIDSATLPVRATAGSTQTINIAWRNRGVAPAYNPFQIQFKFVGPSTSTVILDHSFNTGWADGAVKTESYSVVMPPALTDGVYSVKVKLFDTKSSRNIDLALKDVIKDAEGFFTLGNITVGAVTVQIPAAPTNLSATAVSSSQINLNWTDGSGNEEGFTIERKTIDGTFTAIATTGANTTTYSNTALTPNTGYTYRVIAYNTGGNSASSEPSTATTYASSPSEANLIRNPGFELGNLGNWSITGFAETGSDSFSKHSGGYGARIKGVGKLYQVIPVTPNTTYTVTVWAKDDGSQQTYVGVENFGRSTIDTRVAGTTWTLYTIAFTTGSAASSATVYVRNAARKRWGYSDDWSLTSGYGAVARTSAGPSHIALPMDHPTAKKLIVYPNSSSGEITLLGDKLFDNAAMVITDTRGIVVFRGRMNGETRINLNHLPNGLYLLRAEKGIMVATQKILIAK